MKVITGNIFDTTCQTIVNTVNCEGFMGKGLALEFRFLYPGMYERYKQQCSEGAIQTGNLTIYKESAPWIINFPTKRQWALPSRLEYIKSGLKAFASHYRDWGVESIAFPMLGSYNGGLSQDIVRAEMQGILSEVDIEVEVYQHDGTLIPGYISRLMNRLSNLSTEEARRIRLQPKSVEQLISEFDNGRITSFSSMLGLRGIGEGFVEKVASLHLATVSTTDVGSGQLPMF